MRKCLLLVKPASVWEIINFSGNFSYHRFYSNIIIFVEIREETEQPRPDVLYQICNGDTAPDTWTTGGILLMRSNVRIRSSADFFRPYCQTGRMARQLIGRFGSVFFLMCRTLVNYGLGVFSLSKLRKPNLASSSSHQSSSWMESLKFFCSKIGSDILYYASAISTSCNALKLRLLDQNGNVCENLSQVILDLEHKMRIVAHNITNRILVLISPDRYYQRYQRV